jgi:hypothetical protein
MKDRLKNGHQELLDKGFLERVDYAKAKGTGREKIIYVRKSRAIAGGPIDAEQAATLQVADELSSEVLRERMVALGVKPDEKIAEILQTYTPADIKLQLDCLPHRKDATAGYFIAALKGGWEPPKAFTKRVEGEAQKRAQAALAQREREEQEATARAEREEKEELVKFYQELPARAQTIVNSKVEIELGEAGRVQKIRKGSPAWNAALLVILRDEAFREILLENEDAGPAAKNPSGRPLMASEEPEWDEMDNEASQMPLMPDLSIYAAAVRERLASGWKVEELDEIRMQVAPLLEMDEWVEVKRLATM